MDTIFEHPRYHLRRRVSALAGIIEVSVLDQPPVMICRQKPHYLRQELHVYAASGNPPAGLLRIRAHQICQAALTYDVYAAGDPAPIGALRRGGWRSLRRDTWSVLDAGGQKLGVMQAQGLGQALAYSGARGVFPPQDYLLRGGGMEIARLRQRYNPLRFEMELSFTPFDPPAGALASGFVVDRRLALAAAILLASLAVDRPAPYGVGYN